MGFSLVQWYEQQKLGRFGLLGPPTKYTTLRSVEPLQKVLKGVNRHV